MSGYRVRRKSRIARISDSVAQAVYATYGTQCWLQLQGCTNIATTIDHIYPYVAGGSNALPNLRPACKHCNSKRRNRVINGYGSTIHAVFGLPCSGKTEYVLQHATGDNVVILDYGMMYDSLHIPNNRRSSMSKIVNQLWYSTYSNLSMMIGIDLWITCSLPHINPFNKFLLDDMCTFQYDMHVMEYSAQSYKEWYTTADEYTRRIMRTYTANPLNLAQLTMQKQRTLQRLQPTMQAQPQRIEW